MPGSTSQFVDLKFQPTIAEFVAFEIDVGSLTFDVISDSVTILTSGCGQDKTPLGTRLAEG
jgi:hypothetical protein